MRRVYRAVYWLAAAVVLLTGGDALVGYFIEDFPYQWPVAVTPLVTVFLGAMLLPPVIDYFWREQCLLGFYRIVGVFFACLPIFLLAMLPLGLLYPGLIWSQGSFRRHFFFGDLFDSIFSLAFFMLIGLMILPFFAKRIASDRMKKTLERNAL